MGVAFSMSKAVLSRVLVLFAFMGKVRLNHFVGLRTPRTLAGESVWRKSHRLIGHLWVFGLLMLLPVIWLFPTPADFWAFMGLTAIIIIIKSILTGLHPPKVCQFYHAF